MDLGKVSIMKKSLIAAALLLIPGALSALPEIGPEAPAVAQAGLGDWEGKAEDNVCGLSEVRHVSNPAVIQYEALMRATPEMKEMKRKGIDKDSARGQVLISDARDRVKRAAKAVMSDKGYCSVWKKIQNKRGQKAADITDDVLQQLET